MPAESISARQARGAGVAKPGTALPPGTAVVFAAYLAYVPFEAWWFLRFLLPAWPAIAIGAAALVLAAGRTAGPWGTRVAAAVLLAVGVCGIVMTLRLGVFPPGEGAGSIARSSGWNSKEGNRTFCWKSGKSPTSAAASGPTTASPAT